jgi:hypothetical protein
MSVISLSKYASLPSRKNGHCDVLGEAVDGVPEALVRLVGAADLEVELLAVDGPAEAGAAVRLEHELGLADVVVNAVALVERAGLAAAFDGGGDLPGVQSGCALASAIAPPPWKPLPP